ncbi:MAG: translocation/assembly module TamB domain-containing protein [Rhodobacteraceae bacterium]|nr:translocation/assembly module TamB domain-containing protein [Paracoccaceae bacterium]
MARPLGWRVWAALALLLAVLLGGPALSDAEDDVGVLAGLLQDVLSDAGREVRIRGFDGALSSRATVEEITISDDLGVWIVLSDVVIDWNRAALFNRRVEVNELSAATIELLRLPSTQTDTGLPSPTASEGFSLPELPVSVHVGRIGADLVRLDPSIIGQPAEVSLLGAMVLEGGQGEASFEARRIDLQEGSFVFQGDFDNATRVLSLNLALTEGPGGIATTLLGIPGSPALGLSVLGSGPINTFAADIALSTDGSPRVTGQFAMVDETPETGVLLGGGFALDIVGDLRPLLNAELHPFFGDRSELRATGQRSDTGEISLPELTVTTESMNLSGRASFGADGLPSLVQLTAGIADPAGAPVLLPGTSGSARISSATLLISHDASVSRDWRVRAEIDALDLPQVEVGNATLVGRGRLNALSSPTPEDTMTAQPAFEGVFEFLAQSIAAEDPGLQRAIGTEVFGLASLVWPGPGEVIDLTGLALEGDTVSLTAYGALDGLTFDGFVEFAAPDLAAFSGLAGRDLGGQALVTMIGQANPLTGALDLTADLATTDLSMDIAEADSMLTGESRITMSVLRDTEGTQLRSFRLRAGPVEATMQGTLQPGFVDLGARLMTEDLSRMGPGYGGHLALDVALRTEAGGQRLRFDGTSIDLQLADLPASDFLGGLLDGANRLRGDVVFQGAQTDVALFTFEGPRIAMSANGIWHATDPDLAIALDRLDLSALDASGSGLISGAVQLVGAGDGQRRVLVSVQGDGPLRTGNPQIDGLLSTGIGLDAQLTIAADGALRIDSAQLDSTGLSLLVQGALDAAGNTRMTGQVQLDNLGRMISGLAGPVTLEATVGRLANRSGYDVEATLNGPSALALSTRGRIEDDFTLALVLAGQVESAIFNPSLEPANVSGLIRFNGSLDGAPSLDSLRLDARLSDAHYVLPAAGVAFRSIEAEAHLTGLNAQVRVSGDQQAGGRGSLNGTIDLAASRQADLTVSVEDFAILHPQLFDARIDGSVSLTGPLTSGALVRGEVSVSQAEIRIPNSPLARQGFGLQGLRHVGESAESRRTRVAAGIATGTRHGRDPVPLRLDLTLRAPGRVFVRGRGLDAEMGGTLRLGGTTRDVVPSGSFGLIRGRLDLLGNRFTLTDGSASMVGDFMPFVTLVATTESDGVTTSITVTGRADSPEIVFGSIPELPQDEVLARLIFRRSLASLSPFQAAQLALSVATLTGRADNSILSRTRQAMGLDDLDFTVDDDGNTALRAGRYLSEELYSDVSIDSAGRGEVTINLDLTPSVTLRGRADTEGGSGIGLFFERDY